MKKIVLSSLTMFFVSALTFSASAQCPATCSKDLTSCLIGGTTPQCPPVTCSSNLTVPNFMFSVSGTTVSISSLAICYVPGGTPPWSTSQLAGRLMNVSLRPSATRVFTMGNGLGATFQCTVDAAGWWYVQLISGPAPGVGTNLSGGSYTL